MRRVCLTQLKYRIQFGYLGLFSYISNCPVWLAHQLAWQVSSAFTMHFSASVAFLLVGTLIVTTMARYPYSAFAKSSIISGGSHGGYPYPWWYGGNYRDNEYHRNNFENHYITIADKYLDHSDLSQQCEFTFFNSMPNSFLLFLFVDIHDGIYTGKQEYGYGSGDPFYEASQVAYY